jgi:hypothetical protein
MDTTFNPHPASQTSHHCSGAITKQYLSSM